MPVPMSILDLSDTRQLDADLTGVPQLVLGDLERVQPAADLLRHWAGEGRERWLHDRCPTLTHLYLWGISDLESLPDLPSGLKVLDVRKCPDLVSLPPLPKSLERLIVEECPSVEDLHTAEEGYAKLIELSLRGSKALSADAICKILENAAELTTVDLSDVAQFRGVSAWPEKVDDLRLNGCTNLCCGSFQELPYWPSGLVRLELRHTGLEYRSFRPLPDSIRYLDLGGMTQLRKLPDNWRETRSLFIFGSAIRVPPVSEHGTGFDDDVAEATKDYFAECDLVGTGEVQRCKVLLLGNGNAGKTCLSLCLTGGDPKRTDPKYEPESERVVSTHGVQFYDWQLDAKRFSGRKPQVHVWDFGGQEIYRETHRLFASTGSVFVIVWNPVQFERPRALSKDGDRDRPLAYWLDYVRQAAGPQAEVVVVCSRRDGQDADAKRRIEAEAGGLLEGVKVYYCDSYNKAGQIEELKSELFDMIGRLIDDQGSAVPKTWEIAQDMVHEWLQAQQGASSGRKTHIRKDEFSKELMEKLSEKTNDNRYVKIKAALQSGSYKFDSRRLDHLLAFLTHSGWIFWQPGLGDRVIIGQRWALEGLYYLLLRGDLYRLIKAQRGVFTLSDLERWGFADKVPAREDRELIIKFMEQIGLCETLISADDRLSNEGAYLSLEHLPCRASLSEFSELIDDSDASNWAVNQLPHDELHQGHWNEAIRMFVRNFGRDATYASDGFFAVNAQMQRIEIRFDLNSCGFGGKIDIDVIGVDSCVSSVCDGLTGGILDIVESRLSRRSPTKGLADAGGKSRNAKSVFVSYAWDASSKDGSSGVVVEVPHGYEEPVEAIERELQALGLAVDFRRDKSVLGKYDDFMEFMRMYKYGDMVIVVHSDKYWCSAFCMYELRQIVLGAFHKSKSPADWVRFVSHLGSSVFSVDAERTKLIEYWNGYRDSDFPAVLANNPGLDVLKASVLDILKSQIPDNWGAVSGLHESWTDPNCLKNIVDWVAQQAKS